MAYFKRDRFSGIAPGVSPRLLADQFGQVAENIDFESGRLVATSENSDTYTLQTSTRRSIYFYRDTSWLEWEEDGVSVVPGPIPGDILDRLYFTGDDYPRIGTVATLVSGSSGYPVNSYRLGCQTCQLAAFHTGEVCLSFRGWRKRFSGAGITVPPGWFPNFKLKPPSV